MVDLFVIIFIQRVPVSISTLGYIFWRCRKGVTRRLRKLRSFRSIFFGSYSHLISLPVKQFVTGFIRKSLRPFRGFDFIKVGVRSKRLLRSFSWVDL